MKSFVWLPFSFILFFIWTFFNENRMRIRMLPLSIFLRPSVARGQPICVSCNTNTIFQLAEQALPTHRNYFLFIFNPCIFCIRGISCQVYLFESSCLSVCQSVTHQEIFFFAHFILMSEIAVIFK